MNHFKKLTAAMTAIGVLLLGGCASQQTQYQSYLDNVKTTNATIAEKNAAKAKAESDKYMALAYIAKTATDPATKQMAVMAIALGQQGGGGGGNDNQVAMPQAPQNEALMWTQALAGPIVTLGTGYFGYKSAITASNNSKDTTIASYNAFAGIAHDGLTTAGNIATSGFNANLGIANAGFNTATAGFNAMTNLGTALGQPSITITGDGNSFASANGGNATNTGTYTQRRCTSGNAGNGTGGNGAPGAPGTGGGGAPGGTAPGGSGAPGTGGFGGTGAPGTGGYINNNC